MTKILTFQKAELQNMKPKISPFMMKHAFMREFADQAAEEEIYDFFL